MREVCAAVDVAAPETWSLSPRRHRPPEQPEQSDEQQTSKLDAVHAAQIGELQAALEAEQRASEQLRRELADARDEVEVYNEFCKQTDAERAER